MLIAPSNKDLTSGEMHQIVLKSLEKEFGTGPLIGEGREVILTLLENLYTRDITLDVMGVTLERRKEMFLKVAEITKKNDAETLARRAAAKGGN